MNVVIANEFSQFSPGFDVGDGEIRLSKDRTYEILDAWQPRDSRRDSHFS